MFSLFIMTYILGNVTAKLLWHWDHEPHHVNINYVLIQKFDYIDQRAQFGIGEDDSLSIQQDPTNPNQYVLSVFYRQGTFSDHDHNGNVCTSHTKCQRGAQFYINPKSIRQEAPTHLFTDMTLEYEIYFNHSFQWHNGGKLPGLWGGFRNCSDGRHDHCFSTRLMWRNSGQGEVYAYVPREQKIGTTFDSWCASLKHREIYHKIECPGDYGVEIGTGAFSFSTGKWIKITQHVHLNNPHGYGSVTLWVNDHAEIHMNDIVMRNQFNFGIEGIFFSTFYGGHTHDHWACPADTTTLYRNFRLYTDSPPLVPSQLLVG